MGAVVAGDMRDPDDVDAQRPSPGLWLPAHLSQETVVDPAESPAMRDVGVFLDGLAITGEEGTPENLVQALSGLVTSDVVQSAGKILMSMEGVGAKGVRGGQHEYVDLFPGPLQRTIRDRMEATPGAGAVLFYPQQLLALQRLALRVSKPGPATSFGQGQQWDDFLRACAWVGDVAAKLSGFDAGDGDRRAVATWAIRNGEANRLTFYRGAAGRAYEMWINSAAPWPSGLEGVDDYCQRQFGVTYVEFVAVALSPALARVSLKNPAPADAIFVPSEYLATTRFDPAVVDRIFAELVYGTEAAGPADPATYWSFAGLANRPYIAAPAPNLALSSVRFGFERATTGTFWMLHAAHSGTVGDFTTHFGAVFEDYCYRLARSVQRATCVVRPERKYRNRKGHLVKTSDVLISEGGGCAPASTFVECRALRPRLELFTEGSLDAFDDYFSDLVGKLNQLERVISDYLERRFEIPDGVATANDTVIPLLVLDNPFQWSFAMRALIDEFVRHNCLFRSPQVTAPVVCSVSDYESLLHLVEQGDYVAEIARGYIASGQDMPLKTFLLDRGGVLEVPQMVSDGFSKMTDLILNELKLPPDTERTTTT